MTDRLPLHHAALTLTDNEVKDFFVAQADVRLESTDYSRIYTPGHNSLRVEALVAYQPRRVSSG